MAVTLLSNIIMFLPSGYVGYCLSVQHYSVLFIKLENFILSDTPQIQ